MLNPERNRLETFLDYHGPKDVIATMAAILKEQAGKEKNAEKRLLAAYLDAAEFGVETPIQTVQRLFEQFGAEKLLDLLAEVAEKKGSFYRARYNDEFLEEAFNRFASSLRKDSTAIRREARSLPKGIA